MAQNSTRIVVHRGTRFVRFDNNDSLAVPGLGFDFVHLAAINRGFRHTAFSRRFSHFIPVESVFGFPLISGVTTPEMFQQPTVIVEQPAEEAFDLAGQAGVPAQAPRAAYEPPAPPLPDVGEFVLVRRDGALLFAVAFTTVGDQLTYITREGIRRSLPLAQLDMETTRRMNEERGTTLHLPA